eukprot:11156797-Lingulodinium_polyedra.AAC.1
MQDRWHSGNTAHSASLRRTGRAANSTSPPAYNALRAQMASLTPPRPWPRAHGAGPHAGHPAVRPPGPGATATGKHPSGGNL